MPTSLSFHDRVTNALNFSLPRVQDTDEIILNYLSDEKRQPGKTLLAIYKACYKNSLPESPPKCFSSRGLGNSPVSPMDQYQSFFSPYTTTTLTMEKGREKLLQMCIVLGIGYDSTKYLLKTIGYRSLYDASLFENCIWFILNTEGSLYDLYLLYDEALAVAEDAAQDTASFQYEEETSAISQLYTGFFSLAKERIFESGDSLNKESFLDFVREMAPYFRMHQNAASQFFLGLKDSIHISSLYDYFSPCLCDTQSAFLEQCRQLSNESVHLKYPSREAMILFKLYSQMLTHDLEVSKDALMAQRHLASAAILNDLLEECHFPQTSKQFPFDAVIFELLQYTVEEGSQLNMVQRLLPLYQFAQYGKETLSGKRLASAAIFFDHLLQQDPSFIASCQSWGRARVWVEGEDGKERFVPSREFILFLILLEALTKRGTIPTPAEINVRLTSLRLPPLDSSSSFDRFLFALQELNDQQTIRNILYPFFRFIFSFKQLGQGKQTGDPDAFSHAFATFQCAREDVYTNIPKHPWKSTVAGIFNAIETLYGQMPLTSDEGKLLACQLTVQTKFSQLNVQVKKPEFPIDTITLSIEGQDTENLKYPTRELPDFSRLEQWNNQYYNLHYKDYRIVLSWVYEGRERTCSYPVTLSSKATTQSLLFSCTSPETVQVFRKTPDPENKKNTLLTLLDTLTL